MNKFGHFIKKRRIVLIAFDDEIASMADTVARSLFTEVERDTADEHRWIEPAIGQQPADE